MLTNLFPNEIKLLSHRRQGKEVVQIHCCNALAIYSKIRNVCMHMTFKNLINRATKNICIATRHEN